MSMRVGCGACACVLVAVVVVVRRSPRAACGWQGPGTQAQAAAATPPDASLSIGVGRSKLVKSPLPAKTVTISDPKIADVQILSPTQLLVAGKARRHHRPGHLRRRGPRRTPRDRRRRRPHRHR